MADRIGEESSAILSMLERPGGSGDGSLYRRVTSFLLPFGDLISLDSHRPASIGTTSGCAAPTFVANSKKKRASSKVGEKDGVDATVLRPLAKQFLPFLSRALKILPSVLRKCPREDDNWAGEVFSVYRIVLDCLWCVSSCLAGKLFSVHLQRCSLLCCLETWGRYLEAEEEGFSLLESLVSTLSPSAPEKSHKGRKAKVTSCGRLLPDSTAKDACDVELAVLVIEVVASLIRCAYKSKRKTDALYRRILLMVEEVQPWLRLLDSEAFKKYHLSLVNALCKCSLFLAGECMSFDAALVHNFCLEMSREWLQSSSMEQLPKIARQVCSSLSVQWDCRFMLMLDMLKCLLEFLPCKCKDNVVYCVNEFLEFVHYVIESFQTASASIQSSANELLDKWRSDIYEVSPSVASALGFYAVGLACGGGTVHFQCREASSRSSVYGTDYMQIFGDSLGVLVHNSHSHEEDFSDTLARCWRKFSSLHLEHTISNSCGRVHGDISFFSYLDALGFLCHQLDGYVTAAWKDMVSEGTSSHSADISYVHEAFSQFCVLFLNKINEKPDEERLLESRLILFHVVVASLKICLLIGEDCQRTVGLINHVISGNWVKAQELKYLASSFYNIGASLYNVGQFEKASTALQLCCSTSWTHIKLLCKSPQERDNLSKSMIKDAAVDACAKSAVALDVIHKCGIANWHDIAVDCLLSWSIVENSVETSACATLVKQWVKIVCRDFKDGDGEDSLPVLYLLLTEKCATLSKRVSGIVLEQELLAYEEFNTRNSNSFQRMQLRLMDMLLTEVYVTEENVLPRSKILVKKGRTLKTSGIDGLKSSSQCFSEAISSLEGACSDASRGNSPLYYQLAITYFLRAHCAQEANAKAEVILNDICIALSWWSRMSEDIHHNLDYDKTIRLFLSIVDLSALKGHLRFQLEMCKLIAQLCKRSNVPLENCVEMLWSNRRLSHACCSSSIDEFFVGTLSEEFGVCTNSINFWTSCMKSSHSTLLGFLQAIFLPDAILTSENAFRSQIAVEEVKRTASSLVSNGSLTNDSAFEAGYLFFDLSERLLLEGHLFEALAHAREALRLRKRILQRKFISVGGQPSKIETIWSNDHLFLEAVGSIATKDWPNFSCLPHLEGCYISPWSTLRCYLQSILQVGIIYESIGNGAEAEILFRLGKTISVSLGFPIFGVLFSSHLGQVYRKRQLLDSAEKELDEARRILVENGANVSCKRCEAVLQSLIGLQLGDLFRSKFKCTSRVKCIESLSNALTEYKSAIEKLSQEDLTSKVAHLTVVDSKELADDKSFSLFVGSSDNFLTHVGDKREVKIMPKRSSRKKASDGNPYLRKDFGSEKHQSIHKLARPISHQNRKPLEQCSESSFVSRETADGTEAALVQDMIRVKWECHKRLLSLRLLSKIGKCMRVHSGSHEVHDIFWQSMTLLFDSGPIGQTGACDARLLKLVGLEDLNDIFPVQRAVLLYDMSLFCVKDCFSEGSRVKCCALAKPQISSVFSWLFTAFILTQEIPSLFQKICRSIAAIISLSISTGHFSLPFALESLTESHLAAFFHQASIGTSLQHLYVSSMKDADVKSKDLSNGRSWVPVRDPLEKLSDLEKFVNDFFNSLPSFTVVCISLLGGDYVNLLGETLLLPSFYPAWMLVSRLDFKGQPTVILLPVDFLHEEILDDSANKERPLAKWECPWGHSLLDHVAPQYKVILEDNYMSLSRTTCDVSDTQKSRFLWWSERSRLNNQLDMFLRRIEDSWFGPWRCLLLAERSDCKNLDAVLAKLKRRLRSECKFDAGISILQVIVGGSQSINDIEACVSQMVQYKGCLGRGMCCGLESFRVFSSAVDGGAELMSESIRALILEAFNSTAKEAVEREPIVLVLDSDLLMLPWESLPILRKEEVYRMPSMSSISVTLARNNQRNEIKSLGAFVPSINPFDAYYLLNPSGDLRSTQTEFEGWFTSQNWKGKAGKVPKVEELIEALQKHDLFLYFGHGSGTQYIPGNTIQRLDHCAATLLMGCSSGSLFLRGNYAPHGAPLSYLLAGSPAVIANLWEVSDKDIDRFGKAMLTSWLQASTTSDHYPHSTTKSTIDLRQDLSGPRKTRRRALKNDEPEASKSSGSGIASFMSQSRDVCKLPQLIGAAPVCYGVPTLIRRNQKS